MAMNLDPAPLLSAYLDGELDGQGRRLVEQSLRSDPALADQLASLARVRDLVATLSAPDPIGDASGTVLATLARRSEARRVARRRAVAGIAILMPGLAAAVVLLMASFRGDAAGTPADRLPAGPTIALTPPVAPPPPLVVAPRPARPAPSIATSAVAIPKDRLVAEMKARADREGLDRLLGREDVRQITVVVDTLAPSTLKTFDEVLSKSNRRKPEHARVRLVRPISNDPRQPAPACFYVVTMDDIEHDLFLHNLEERFPKVTSNDGALTPQALATMSRVGQVEIMTGVARATLRNHPPAEASGRFALEHPESTIRRETFVKLGPRGDPSPSKSVSDVPARPSGKDPKEAGSGLAAAEPVRRSEDLAARAERERPSDDDAPARVYVVWLTARERSRP